MAHYQREKVYCGTPSYMAPEILLKKPYHPGPADVWALGVLLYILLCGQFPHKGRTDRELLSNMRGCSSIYYPDYISKDVTTMIKKIFIKSPGQRISAAQILMDKWVTTPKVLLQESAKLKKLVVNEEAAAAAKGADEK